MTPVELAALRDKVSRAQLERAVVRARENKLGWSDERLAAGDQALAALRKADARNRKADPVPPTPRLSLRCVYCGKRVRIASQSKRYGVPATCGDHRDLPALDPHYAEAFA